MQVIVDTNVLISGIFWGGLPREILTLWNEDKIHLLASPEILEEYSRVLTSFGKKHHREDEASAWDWFITENISIIRIKTSFKVCRDPDDNKYLDCAVSGKAPFIITGDKDLLHLDHFMNVRIHSPKDFLNHFYKK